MKLISLVPFAFFLLVLQAGLAASECERKVLEEIERCGRHIGHDAVRDEFVSVQHAFFNCKDSDGSAWQLLRDRAFDEALGKARLEIAQGMRAELRSSNSVRRRREGASSCKVVESTFTTESHDMLWGFEIIAMHEVIQADRYGMALAVAWGVNREMSTARSFSGDSIPAEDWKVQLKERVQLFGGGVPRLDSFTDSSGFVHCYAASVCDVSCVPMPLRGIRIKEGEMKALRRLQLWRDGWGRSGSQMNLSLESRKGESSRLRRERGRGVDSEASGAMAECTCVFEEDVPDSLSGHILHVLVYALEPCGVASGFSDDKQKRQDKPLAGKRVKIFNPATGKYEEVCK